MFAKSYKRRAADASLCISISETYLKKTRKYPGEFMN